MSQPGRKSNVTLPPIRSVFPDMFQSPPSSFPGNSSAPLNQKQPPSQRPPNPASRQPFPFAAPSNFQQGRRVSTASTSSSVPSLTYSPTPSPAPAPEPTRHPSHPQTFVLVPCPMRAANAAVVLNCPPPKAAGTNSNHDERNKPLLLVGEAMTRPEYANRKKIPYRMMPESRSR